MANKLAVLGLPGFGMESPLVSEQMKHSVLETKLATFFRTYKSLPSQKAAYDYLAVRSGREAAVVSERPTKERAVCPYERDDCKHDEIKLLYSSYNRLLFEVVATEDGLFKAGIPFYSNWRVSVDGKPQTPVRTDGYAVGVFVEKGKRQVELRFAGTASTVGFVFFACTIAGLSVFFSFGVRRRGLKVGAIVIGIGIGCGIFLLQYRSLYNGENLMTKYQWTSREIRDEGNLAFGKRTEMSTVKSHERPYDYYAGRAVDGDMSTESLTSPGKFSPWWQVDLGKSEALSELVIYEGAGSSLKGLLPLKIRTSSNGRKYQDATVITEPPQKKVWHIDLSGQTARYIRIQSTKTGALSFKEVQVFGAAGADLK